MNRNVIMTCTITGAGNTADKHRDSKVAPTQIAHAAIEAARAGATIVHSHVRNPETGKGSRNKARYRKVVSRICESEIEVMINLTKGMGSDLYLDSGEQPLHFSKDNDLAGSIERLVQVDELMGTRTQTPAEAEAEAEADARVSLWLKTQ